MKNFHFSLIVLILLFLSHSCKSKKTPTVEINPVDSSLSVTKELIDTIPIDYLSNILDSVLIGKENYVIGERIHAEKALPEFYQLNENAHYWEDSLRANEAILILIAAWKDGLNPKDYHLESILELNDYIASHPNEGESKAIFDVLLSDGLLHFADHLNQGKLDPSTLSTTWNFFARNLPQDALGQLKQKIDSDSIASFFTTLTPQSNTYIALRDGIIKYTNIVYMGSWKDLPVVNSIHPYDSTALAPLLRKRLITEGYELIEDSSRVYDSHLVAQVKLFQESSGLISDGVIGKHTINAFNESAESKLNKLKVNMERDRWVLEGELNAFIIVNIARYEMYYSDSARITYRSKVMVGKDEKQTPVFRDNLQYIVFNPTWTLPTSISSTETLPHLQKDSLYLEKHNMVIIDAKGEAQSDSGIVWSEYTEDYFPFMFRQEPGPSNALGRVKFLFPNQYAIYLHDTPSRYLFAKEERAFSHGCIRLQDPLDFAQFLLAKEDTLWTSDSIRTVIDSAQTMSVRLKRSIPIYIMYWTAGVNEWGNLFFVPDIYGRDERILKALGEL